MDKPQNIHIPWADTGAIDVPLDAKKLAGFDVEIFPYQQWNYLLNKAGVVLAEKNAYGFPLWKSTTVYPPGAVVLYNSVVYQARVGSINVTPTDPVSWKIQDGLAVGAIKMHVGAWVDGVTKPGWYACTAANAAHGAPDLVDKFIRGSLLFTGTEKGSNDILLIASDLPPHSHTVSGGTIGVGDTHTHTYYTVRRYNTGTSTVDYSRDISLVYPGAVSALFGTGRGWLNNNTSYRGSGETRATDQVSSGHTHDLAIVTDPTGLGNAKTVNYKHYKTILIRKCY